MDEVHGIGIGIGIYIGIGMGIGHQRGLEIQGSDIVIQGPGSGGTFVLNWTEADES